jgi:hypothetical protein
LVLRLNQETRASSLHVPGVDRTRRHLTSRPPGHRVPDQRDHPRSSAPDLLVLLRASSLHVMPHLPTAHHETSKHNSPNETKVKEKQNKTIADSNSNLANSMTHHNQTKELTTWFLTFRSYKILSLKSKFLSLNFSKSRDEIPSRGGGGSLSHPKIPISDCEPFFSKRDSHFPKGFHLFEFKKIYFIYFVFIIEFKESKWCSIFLLNDSLSCENLQNKRYCL